MKQSPNRKQKLSLKALEIQSFITTLTPKKVRTIKGGSRNCIQLNPTNDTNISGIPNVGSVDTQTMDSNPESCGG